THHTKPLEGIAIKQVLLVAFGIGLRESLRQPVIMPDKLRQMILSALEYGRLVTIGLIDQFAHLDDKVFQTAYVVGHRFPPMISACSGSPLHFLGRERRKYALAVSTQCRRCVVDRE